MFQNGMTAFQTGINLPIGTLTFQVKSAILYYTTDTGECGVQV